MSLAFALFVLVVGMALVRKVYAYTTTHISVDSPAMGLVLVMASMVGYMGVLSAFFLLLAYLP